MILEGHNCKGRRCLEPCRICGISRTLLPKNIAWRQYSSRMYGCFQQIPSPDIKTLQPALDYRSELLRAIMYRARSCFRGLSVLISVGEST